MWMLLLAHSINFIRGLGHMDILEESEGDWGYGKPVTGNWKPATEAEKLRRGRDGAYLLVTLKHMRTKLLYA